MFAYKGLNSIHQIKNCKMRKLLLLVLCQVFFLFGALAQNRTISGKVTDENGKAVTNASVLVKGTRIGTITKTDGSFTLTVPGNAKTLLFSSLI